MYIKSISKRRRRTRAGVDQEEGSDGVSGSKRTALRGQIDFPLFLFSFSLFYSSTGATRCGVSMIASLCVTPVNSPQGEQ